MKLWEILLLIVIALNLQFGCSRDPRPDPQDDPPSPSNVLLEHNHETETPEIAIDAIVAKEIGIRVVPVSKRAMHKRKTFPGVVIPRPDGEAFVGSLIEGRITEVLVGIGDLVEQGAPLCRVESPQIGAAQAAYIRAVAENEFVQKDLIRHKKLRDEHIDSEKDYLQKEALAQTKAAELAATERALRSFGFSKSEIVALGHDYSASGVLILKSPIRGSVVDWNVRQGQRVEPDDDLFHIVDLSRLWVQMSIYEGDLTYMYKGQKAEIRPQSLPDKLVKGELVRIGGKINPDTKTIDCFINIENKEGLLIPNVFVNCQVQLGILEEEALCVPEEAIVLDAHGDKSVYREHEPNHFVPVEIETGRTCDGWVEVVSGLPEGERIVFAGAFFLKSEAAKGHFGHGHAH